MKSGQMFMIHYSLSLNYLNYNQKPFSSVYTVYVFHLCTNELTKTQKINMCTVYKTLMYQYLICIKSRIKY